jgi:hypothetical protein
MMMLMDPHTQDVADLEAHHFTLVAMTNTRVYGLDVDL